MHGSFGSRNNSNVWYSNQSTSMSIASWLLGVAFLNPGPDELHRGNYVIYTGECFQLLQLFLRERHNKLIYAGITAAELPVRAAGFDYDATSWLPHYRITAYIPSDTFLQVRMSDVRTFGNLCRFNVYRIGRFVARTRIRHIVDALLFITTSKYY